MQILWQDLRYCLRTMIKRPGLTIVATLTLALGIGASAAVFSVVNVVILNPFPYRDPSQLFLVRQRMPRIGVTDQLRSSGPEFLELTQSQSFEKVAAFEPVSRNLTGGEEPERVAATKVSTDFFSVLGVDPLIGRTISPEEQGAAGERVLVIGYALWQKRFGGDMNVLGQKVFLDDEPFTIIGVMPPRFRFDGSEAWFPFPFDFDKAPRSARAFVVVARLKPETTIKQVEAELETIARGQEQSYIGTNPEYAGRGLYLQSVSEFYFGPVRQVLFILLGAVALVLLIACANIANLLLARSLARTHEMAVRAAMGAGRFRLIRQLLTESAALALVGGTAGLLLAAWGIDALVALIPAGTIPPGTEVHIDSTVLLFALSTTLATSLVFGVWPALQISKPEIQETLKSGSQRTTSSARHRRAQNLLIIAEVSLSLVLLVGAGLMIRSLARLMNIDPGMKTENLLSMRLNRSPAKTKDGTQMAAFFEQTIERVRSVPGVEGVAATSHTPFVFTEDWTVTIDSNAIPPDMQTQNIDTRTVSADYFRVMGIPLTAGEFFSGDERPNTPLVIIINQAMARRFWKDEDPLGKRIKIKRGGSESPWFAVKGVVKDSAQGSLDAEIKPEAYFAMGQMAGLYRRMNLVIRSGGDPKPLVGAIESAIREVDKDQPVYQVQTIEELISDSTGARRFAMLLLMIFASLAVALASIGIYGVMNYSVSQRTHEIGLRMALGASRADVLRLVVGQGMKLAAVGIVIGVGAALALTRLMKSLLYEVSATDLATFSAISLLLAVVALVAVYLPARRASKVDPQVALRYE
ncbi:MAG TPA: ABC transporter permease [Blastocatellia bacterium]